MPRKYVRRYLKPDGWNFKNNHLVGTEWSVAGSKAGTFYAVVLTDKGFSCDCTGFQFHGKCKHSNQVAERFDDAES